MKLKSILKIISAIEKSGGTGITLLRSIGMLKQRRYNPFLLCDHFFSYGKGGFPKHPHRGQETITMILEGSIAHEDFTGSKGILYSGDLQFMTAGKGIVHAEMPISTPNAPTIALQLWVDLPNKLKDTPPRYRDLKSWEVPEVIQDNGKVRTRIISGKAYGVESIKELSYTPVEYYHYIMKPGATFKHVLPLDFNFFLYVLKGNSLTLNDSIDAKQYHNYFFENDGDTIVGKNTSDFESGDVEFVLIGGKELKQDVVQSGLFVAPDKEGIKQAFEDYKNQENGFENLKTWKSLISKGVTEEMIEGPLNGSLEQRQKQKATYLENQNAIVKSIKI